MLMSVLKEFHSSLMLFMKVLEIVRGCHCVDCGCFSYVIFRAFLPRILFYYYLQASLPKSGVSEPLHLC